MAGDIKATILELRAEDHVSPVLHEIEKQAAHLSEHAGIDMEKFGSLFTEMGGPITAVGAAFGVASVALIGLTEHAIANAAEMGKMAEKAAMNVEEFSKLAFAANIAETSTETLLTGIKFLNKAVAEAVANPNGSMASLFREMSVELTDANGKIRPTSQLLLDLAEKFSGFAEDANKGALAMRFFGRSGVEMLPFLNKSKEGLQELMDQTRGVTKETSDMARAYEENLRLLGRSFTEMGKQFSAELLPYLLQFTNWLVKAQRETGLFTATADILVTGLKGLATGLYTVYIAAETMGKIFVGEIEVLNAFRIAMVEVASTATDDFSAAIAHNVEIIGHMITVLKDAGGALSKLFSGDVKGAAKEAAEAFVRVSLDVKDMLKNDMDYWAGASTSTASGISKAAAAAKSVFNATLSDIKADWSEFDKFINKMWGGKPPVEHAKTEADKPSAPHAEKTDKDTADILKLDELERKIANDQLEGIEKIQAAHFEEYQQRLEKAAEFATTQEGYDRVAALAYDAYTKKTDESDQEWSDKHQNILDEMAIATLSGYDKEVAAAEHALNKKLAMFEKEQLAGEELDWALYLADEEYLNALTVAENNQADKEKKIKQEQWNGVRGILSDSANAAKAFGKQGLAAYKGFATAQATMDTYTSAVAAYKSVVGIPYVGPVLAVIAAAAAVAAGVANVARIQSVSAAHGGLDYVPRDETYLLREGERVLQPKANQDLTQFLNQQGPGGSSNTHVNVLTFNGEQAAQRWADGNGGDSWFIDKLEKHARRVVRRA